MTGQLQVTSLESTQQFTTNGTITVGQTTINSTSINIQGSNAVINATSVAVGNSSQNTVLNALISDNAIFVGNTNYFPAPLDIFSWASAAVSFNNCTISRDNTITLSPAGGIPFKVTQTGPDPHPGTYNSNTWNLVPIAPGDVIKTSGYIRIDVDAELGPSQYLLNLPANTSGNFGTLTKTDQVTRINATANEWYYFEVVSTITGSNSGFMQIRPDGYGVSVTDTVANTWYDGIKVEKGTTLLVTETVNTQIFTANSTWTKPSWATTGNELVVVHMWGGGGGGANNTGGSGAAGGGGGAMVFGYYKASQLGSTANVVVGAGGLGNTITTANGFATNGENSSFANNTNGLLVAYGGGGAWANTTNFAAPGSGGGWLSAGQQPTSIGAFTDGGGPLGGNSTSTVSTFGGARANATGGFASGSVYGGGAGGTNGGGTGGNSIFGGAGGGSGVNPGRSIYGGNGGNNTVQPSTPGGGGGRGQNGARGEVRVYTYRITG